MFNKIIKETDLCTCFLFFVFLVCLVRIFFGFDWSDEAYYAALSFRFIQGDLFFVDSWDTLQISSVLLIPFIKLFLILFKSTDYLYLYLRVIYTLLQFFVAVYFYHNLKSKKNDVFVCGAAVLVFVSINSIRTLSYKSIPTLIIPVIYVLLVKERKFERMNCFFVGILVAITVGSFYSLIVLIPLILAYFLRNKDTTQQRTKCIFSFFLGGITMALVIFAYLFRGISMHDVIANMEIMMQISTGYSTSILNYFSGIVHAFGEIYMSIFVICMILLRLFIKLKKSKLEACARPVDILLIIISNILLVVNLYHQNYYYAFANSMLLIVVYFLNVSFNLRKPVLLMLFGASYSVATHLLSNMGFVASFQPLLIVLMGYLLYLSTECVSFSKVQLIGNILRINALICCVLILAFNLIFVYRDGPLGLMNSRIEIGPVKGIYTTQDRKIKMERLLTDIDMYTKKMDLVIYSELFPFGYLLKEVRQGSPITWRINLDNKLLEEWYLINKHKLPNTIYLLNDTCSEENGENMKLSNFMYDYISTMKEVHTRCGIIYTNNDYGS